VKFDYTHQGENGRKKNKVKEGEGETHPGEERKIDVESEGEPQFDRGGGGGILLR